MGFDIFVVGQIYSFFYQAKDKKDVGAGESVSAIPRLSSLPKGYLFLYSLTFFSFLCLPRRTNAILEAILFWANDWLNSLMHLLDLD